METPVSKILNGEIPSLKVGSFRLKDHFDSEDIEFYVKEISDKSPDVVAIQGVTKRNCDILFRTFKSLGYQFSRFDKVSSAKDRESSEILFSKIPVLKKEFKLFVGSRQNRGISKYLVKAGSRTETPFDVWVMTSQFEVGGSGNGVRKTQILEVAAEADKNVKEGGCDIPTIFAGDTQIPSWQNTALYQPAGWYDAWRERGTSATEKTSEQDRMDQIWWIGRLLCTKFELCCDNEAIITTFHNF